MAGPPSQSPSPEPFPELSQNPSENAVLLYDPLGILPLDPGTWKLSPHHCPTPAPEKIAPVQRVSFWRGVLRDYLLRRHWRLSAKMRILGNKRKRQLLRSLSPDPPSRRTPCGQGQFFCLSILHATSASMPSMFDVKELGRSKPHAVQHYPAQGPQRSATI